MVSDDLVKRFSDAIAHAEGFYADASDGTPNLPQRCNNPGDLTDDGDIGLGTARSTGIGATNITIYRSLTDGWNALYKKVRRALDGESTTYPTSMTIEEFGTKYSEDSDWGINVAARLRVSDQTTLSDLAAADLIEQKNWSANG